MTNIAIKNGAVIVKDGKVAEDCACCGGWYCYPNLCSTNFDGTPTLWACDQDAAESVAIQVTYSGNKWCHWLRSPTNPNMAVQYTFEASAEFNEIVALQNMKQVFVYMLTGGINRYAYPCVFKGIVHGHDMIVFPGAYNGSRAKFGDPWEAFIQGAFPVKVIRQDNTVTSVASLESNRTRCTTSTDGSVQPNGTVVVSGLRQTNVMFNFLNFGVNGSDLGIPTDGGPYTQSNGSLGGMKWSLFWNGNEPGLTSDVFDFGAPPITQLFCTVEVMQQ